MRTVSLLIAVALAFSWLAGCTPPPPAVEAPPAENSGEDQKAGKGRIPKQPNK